MSVPWLSGVLHVLSSDICCGSGKPDMIVYVVEGRRGGRGSSTLLSLLRFPPLVRVEVMHDRVEISV